MNGSYFFKNIDANDGIFLNQFLKEVNITAWPKFDEPCFEIWAEELRDHDRSGDLLNEDKLLARSEILDALKFKVYTDEIFEPSSKMTYSVAPLETTITKGSDSSTIKGVQFYDFNNIQTKMGDARISLQSYDSSSITFGIQRDRYIEVGLFLEKPSFFRE